MPSRHDSSKWKNTEKEWFYCFNSKGGSIRTWRHLSELKFPIMGTFNEVNIYYRPAASIYNVPAFGNRIELYEISEDFEQEIAVRILKGHVCI